MNSFIKVVVVILCVVSIGLVGYLACLKSGGPFAEEKEAKEKTTVIETVTSKSEEVQPTTEFEEAQLGAFSAFGDKVERAEWENLKKEYDLPSQITYTGGTAKDDWLYRELYVSEFGDAIVTYSCDTYEKAVKVSGIGNVFNTEYKRWNRENFIWYLNIVDLSEKQEVLEKSIVARFEYKKGLIFLREEFTNRFSDERFCKNIEENTEYTGFKENANKVRTYTSKAGYTFELYDGTSRYSEYDEEDVKCTFAIIWSESENTILKFEFRDLSESEIQEVFETVVMPDDNIDTSELPVGEKRDDLIKEIKENAPKKKN